MYIARSQNPQNHTPFPLQSISQKGLSVFLCLIASPGKNLLHSFNYFSSATKICFVVQLVIRFWFYSARLSIPIVTLRCALNCSAQRKFCCIFSTVLFYSVLVIVHFLISNPISPMYCPFVYCLNKFNHCVFIKIFPVCPFLIQA